MSFLPYVSERDSLGRLIDAQSQFKPSKLQLTRTRLNFNSIDVAASHAVGNSKDSAGLDQEKRSQLEDLQQASLQSTILNFPAEVSQGGTDPFVQTPKVAAMPHKKLENLKLRAALNNTTQQQRHSKRELLQLNAGNLSRHLRKQRERFGRHSIAQDLSLSVLDDYE